jgi:endonuclease/exonuclease/phosphatase family metal-dependent hydrolase
LSLLYLHRPEMTNPATFRIATWNLDRPAVRRKSRSRERFAELQRHSADVWILTETDRELELPGYTMVATRRPDHPGYADREAYAAVHSRWPMRLVELTAFDSCFGVCAEIESPLGPLLVHGSIITYHNDGVADGKAKPWERHRESVRQHGKSWKELRSRFPNHHLIVGGDFNQALDGVGRYRDKQATVLLRAAFEDAILQCLTTADFTKPPKSLSRHSIDHIAVSRSLLAKATSSVDVWEGVNPAGVSLSDHNGVVVSLTVG